MELLDGSGITLVHIEEIDSEASKELLRKEWLCVLLDLKVPPYDGRTTVKRVRALTGNSIVILTALYHDGIEEEMIREGADDLLIKSVTNSTTLVRAVKVAQARHLRRMTEDETGRLVRAQMTVLTELATLMTDIRDGLSPKPLLKNFFVRLSDPKGKKEIEAQIKGIFWFVGRIILEVGAIVAALRGLGEL